MDFELNETERMLVDTLARFAQDAGAMDAAEQSAHGRRMGWHGAPIPEELGGFGMGMVGPMLVAEHLGAALSPLCWQRDAVLPAIALVALARAGQDGPLARFIEGEAIGFADGGLRLDGAELAHGDGPAVAAPLAELRAAATITAAADHLGAMQQLFAMTLEYSRTRQQFGRPLSSFQALQHRLVDMFVAVEETRALVMAAAMAASESRADAPHLAAAAWDKARTRGQQIAQEAIQLHGGIGMTAECRVGDYVKRMLRNTPAFPVA